MLQVAQAVLMPLLVNRSNVGPSGQVAIRQMMIMDNPFATPESPQESRAQLPSGRSPRRRFEPADTASWRLRMLNSGNLSDADFRRIRSAASPVTKRCRKGADAWGLQGALSASCLQCACWSD